MAISIWRATTVVIGSEKELGIKNVVGPDIVRDIRASAGKDATKGARKPASNQYL